MENEKILNAILLTTKKDSNGNPRKLVLLLADGEIVEAIDLGYRSHSAVKEFYPEVDKVAIDLAVTIGEYNRLKRLFCRYR